MTATKFVTKGSASVLVDGQYGSTGKGMFAAFVGAHTDVLIDFATTNAGSNSGHTVIRRVDNKPVKKVAYHLPWTAASHGHSQEKRRAHAYLNAGSIIDPDVLEREISDLGLSGRQVTVHPFAAVIRQEHKKAEAKAESSATKIASTQKGVGAALADKIRRIPSAAFAHEYANNPKLQKICRCDVISLLDEMTKRNKSVFVEVSQGFSLSLNASGFYPFTTSRDCTVMQALSDACINPAYLGRVLMTMRTYPIRVGNIEKNGHLLGQSGGIYRDQEELTWAKVGREPELTTVTGRVRRVFTWSHQQCVDAMRINRPDDVFINFCNYLKKPKELDAIVQSINGAADVNKLKRPRLWFGFGPDHFRDVESNLKRARDKING